MPAPFLMRPNGAQNVAVTTTSAASAAVGASTTAVRLAVTGTSPAYVVFGKTPTATVATGMLINPADMGEIFKCQPGEKIAAICGTGTTSLNIVEMTA